jgi:hypothetical protein
MNTALIQEMQMCLLCAPFFDRKEQGGVLAHEIGLHVKVWQDGYTDLNGNRVEFQNESSWAPITQSK